MKRYIAIMAVTIDGQPDEAKARSVANFIASDLADRDFGDAEVRGTVDDWFWDEVSE